MRCETTYYGEPCNSEAEFIVSGGTIRQHPTCEYHKKKWQEQFPDAKIEPIGEVPE